MVGFSRNYNFSFVLCDSVDKLSDLISTKGQQDKRKDNLRLLIICHSTAEHHFYP